MTVSFARLGDLAEQIRGVTYGKEDASKTPIAGYLPVLRAGNITDSGLVFEDLVYVPEARVATRQRIKKGDIVIAASSGSLDIVGKAAPALDAFAGGFGAFCKVIRPNNKIDARYLAQFFKTPSYRRTISNLAAGANINNLKSEHLDDLRVPLPSLPEQRRIAAILDQADALKAKRREALAQLDSLTQSIFIEMFGDPVENPKGWQKRQLGTICEVGSSKRVFVEELVDEGIPFYRGTEVGQLGEDREVTPSLFISVEHYDRLKREAGVPRPGDLLLPSICPDGRIFSVESDKPFYFKDGRVLWIKASQGSINSPFLRHQLKHIFAKNYAQIASGTTFAELKIFALKDAEVCTPPLDLQMKFARIAHCLKLQQRRSRSSLRELDALFVSLQQRSFSGQLS